MIAQTTSRLTVAFRNCLIACSFGAAVLTAFAAPALAVEIQTVTSDKGIKALLVEDYTVPLIAVSFSWKGGATQDAPGREGTANLLTTLLDEGAGDIESKEFLAKIEDLGVQYRFTSDYDTFDGRLQTLKSNSDEVFDLVALAITKPRFDAEPIARMKAAASVGLRGEETDPNAIAGKALRESAYGDHPYGRPANGTLESLESITRDDIIDYHKRVFARDNLTIGVVGAISASELKSKLDRLFGDLPEKSGLKTIPEIVVKTGETKHIDLNVPQSSIAMVLPGIKRDHPDFFAAYLVNYVLGGGSFNSRLYEEVREKRGLAYGVYSYLGTRDHAGTIGAGSATRADRAQQTVDIIKAEMKRMAEEGPTAEELEKAKKYIKGSYAISNLDTSTKIAGVLVAIQQADLGLDYIDKRGDLIDAVTLADAKRVAKQYLSAEPTVVTVGPPREG